MRVKEAHRTKQDWMFLMQQAGALVLSKLGACGCTASDVAANVVLHQISQMQGGGGGGGSLQSLFPTEPVPAQGKK